MSARGFLEWWLWACGPNLLWLSGLAVLLIAVVSKWGWRKQQPVLLALLGGFGLLPWLPLLSESVSTPAENVRIGPEIDGLPGSALITMCLGGFWLGGWAVAMAFWCRAWWRLRQLWWDAKPLSEDALRKLIGDEVVCALASRRIRVRTSDRMPIHPCCFGWRNRCLLLPHGRFMELAEDERRLVLWHEYGHGRWTDAGLLLLQNILTRFYWWHPVVWWGCRRLTLVREGLCDETVLRAGGDPGRYASLLIAFGEGEGGMKGVGYAMGSPYHDLKERIARMMAFPVHGRQRGFSKVALCGLIVLMGIGLAVLIRWATLRPRPHSESQPVERDMVLLDEEAGIERLLDRSPDMPPESLQRHMRWDSDDPYFTREMIESQLKDGIRERPAMLHPHYPLGQPELESSPSWLEVVEPYPEKWYPEK